MGHKDTVLKKLMATPQTFADAFNYLLYRGRQVIKPEELKELDTQLLTLPYGADGVVSPEQKVRDVLKYQVQPQVVGMADRNSAYLLLAIENQADIHYAMPVKSAVYDALQYSKQVAASLKSYREGGKLLKPEEYLSGFAKTDRLVPVITLVIYFGAKKWDGARSIHEMLVVSDPNILKYVANYEINLIAPEEMSLEEFDLFHSDLREILKFVKYSEDKSALREMVDSDSRFKNLDYGTAQIIGTLTNAKQIELKPNKEGKVDMCKALADIRLEGLIEGRLEGETRGRLEGIAEGRLEGETRGVAKGIISLMESMGFNTDQAMNALRIPTEDRSIYEKLIAELKK